MTVLPVAVPSMWSSFTGGRTISPFKEHISQMRMSEGTI